MNQKVLMLHGPPAASSPQPHQRGAILFGFPLFLQWSAPNDLCASVSSYSLSRGLAVSGREVHRRPASQGRGAGLGPHTP